MPDGPGINDTKEEIQAIAGFASSLPGVDRIHLLPYHNFGRGKYEGLGRPYTMGEAPLPTAEKMALLKKAVEEVSALECIIGG